MFNDYPWYRKKWSLLTVCRWSEALLCYIHKNWYPKNKWSLYGGGYILAYRYLAMFYVTLGNSKSLVERSGGGRKKLSYEPNEAVVPRWKATTGRVTSPTANPPNSRRHQTVAVPASPSPRPTRYWIHENIIFFRPICKRDRRDKKFPT